MILRIAEPLSESRRNGEAHDTLLVTSAINADEIGPARDPLDLLRVLVGFYEGSDDPAVIVDGQASLARQSEIIQTSACYWSLPDRVDGVRIISGRTRSIPRDRTVRTRIVVAHGRRREALKKREPFSTSA